MSNETAAGPQEVSISIVADAIGAAEEVPLVTEPGPQTPAKNEPADPPPAEPDGDLPEDCPVVALGLFGDDYFYLDNRKQLKRVHWQRHQKNMVRALFGGRSYFLASIWPRHGAKGQVMGWDGEAAVEALIAACDRKGIWNPAERERGVGAWLGENGELVLHCGDAVWCGPPAANGVRTGHFAAGTWREPGLIGRYVYPAAEAGPKPTDRPQPDCEAGPAYWLLEFFGSWNWRRGRIDAVLLLGWVGAAMLGGALDWRPLCWISGKTGSGKSTIDEVLKLVFDHAAVVSRDATGASIWQKLGHDTVPVIIDELEAKDDNRKAEKIIEVARAATDGSLVLRGGADHVGHEFIVRSCFLFSSILIPPMLAQDRNRQAFLDLKKIEGRAPLVVDHEKLRATGAALRRRLADGWPRLAQALAYYRLALEEKGHTMRGAKQFGTILAIAHILLYDGEVEAETDDGWTEELRYEDLVAWVDDTTDDQAFLEHIATTTVDPHRGGQRQQLGDWIGQAANEDAMISGPADKVLRSYGLRVRVIDGERFLAVACNHKGLADILSGTHWIGRSGARNPYVQTLRNVDGMREGNVWFGAKASRAVLVPLDLIWQEEEHDR